MILLALKKCHTFARLSNRNTTCRRRGLLMDLSPHTPRSDGWEVDDEDFEKIRRHTKPRLPVASDRARRSAKETAGSRRVRKEISRTSGGMHRRRQKKVI